MRRVDVEKHRRYFNIRNTIGYSSPSSWKMLTFCTDMRKKWCELLEIHIRVFNDVSIADSTSGSVGLIHNHSDLLARRQNESESKKMKS